MSTTPPNNGGHVPSGKVTAFDKGQYDNLIAWVDGVDQDLEKNLNKPRPGVRLDDSLGGGIRPGSPDWNVAARFVSKATEFGKSVVERYADLDKDWEQYVMALRGARDVFETTNNLNNYSAAKFLNDYPDMSSSSTGGGPGGNAGGPGGIGGGTGGGSGGGSGGGTGNNSSDNGTGGKSGTGDKSGGDGTGNNSGDGGTGGKSGGGSGGTRTQVPSQMFFRNGMLPVGTDGKTDGGTGGTSGDGGDTRTQVPDQPLSAATYRSFEEIPAKPPVVGPGDARPAVSGGDSGGGGGGALPPAPGHAVGADSGSGVAPTPAPDQPPSAAIHRSFHEIPAEPPVLGPGQARPAVSGGDSGGGGGGTPPVPSYYTLTPAPGHAVSAAIHPSFQEIPAEAPVVGPGDARPAVIGGDSGDGGGGTPPFTGYYILTPAPGDDSSPPSKRPSHGR